MSLKKTAMKMALAFAAAKGYQAFKQQGGIAGLKQKLSSGSGTSQGGGLAGMLGSLASGSSTQGGSGGLGSLLGGLSGGGGSSNSSLSGLLGGLAAMAGGTAMAGQDRQTQMDHAETGPVDDATAAAMIRVIGQAVRTDGEIDAGERAALHDILGDAETDEDRAAIEAALSEPIDPVALARDVPIGSEEQVYAAALTAIDPDHPAEKAFLRKLGTSLRLGDDTIRQLHATAGKPA